MEDRRPRKDALFEAIAVMGKALASPRRLELLEVLAQAPRTVDELARASDQSNANTSQHLQVLHSAGLVTRQREGTSVRYALAGDEVLRVWVALRDASAAQLSRGRARRPAPTSATRSRASTGLSCASGYAPATSCSSTCAPPEEFEAGHIEGARSIPHRRAGGAARRAAGRSARSSPTAAARSAPTPTRRCGELRDAGHDARRLEDGWPEWRLAIAQAARGARSHELGWTGPQPRRPGLCLTARRAAPCAGACAFRRRSVWRWSLSASRSSPPS